MRKNYVHFDADKCKSCGLCAVECPHRLLELSKETNISGYHPMTIPDSTHCTGCTLCAIACPDSVITITREED